MGALIREVGPLARIVRVIVEFFLAAGVEDIAEVLGADRPVLVAEGPRCAHVQRGVGCDHGDRAGGDRRK